MREVLETVASFHTSYVATLGLVAMCAYLGTFTLLRRIVFTGAALSQAAAAGVAASFWLLSLPLPPGVAALVQRFGPAVGSLIVSVGCALGLGAGTRRASLSADARVGIVFAASSALAVLFVWRSSSGLVELQSILAGDVLLSSARERSIFWFGLAAVALVHIRLRARFLLVGYDPDFARAQGLSVAALERIFLVTLAVAVAVALRTGGLMLVFGTLVLPPVFGLRVAPTLTRATLTAVAWGWSSALIGFLAATAWNLPVAPTIVAVQLAGLAPALLPPAARALELCAGIGGIAALLFAFVLPAWRPAPQPPPEVRGRPFIQRAPDTAGRHAAATHASPSEPLDPHAHVGDAEGLEQVIAQHAAVLADHGASMLERMRAADVLGRLPDARVVRPLVEASGDPDPAIAAKALRALAPLCRAPEGPCRLELAHLAESSEPELAALAARAELRAGHASAAARVAEHISDETLPFLLREELERELARFHSGQ